MKQPTRAQRIRWTAAGVAVAAVGAGLLFKTEHPSWVGFAVLLIGCSLMAPGRMMTLFKQVKDYLPWGPKR